MTLYELHRATPNTSLPYFEESPLFFPHDNKPLIPRKEYGYGLNRHSTNLLMLSLQSHSIHINNPEIWKNKINLLDQTLTQPKLN